MNPKRKKRLIIVLMIVFGASAAIGLTMYALSQNINLFYSPTQIAEGEAPAETRIRAGCRGGLGHNVSGQSFLSALQ